MLTMNDGANSVRVIDSNGNSTEVRATNMSSASASAPRATRGGAFSFAQGYQKRTKAAKKRTSPTKSYNNGHFSASMFESNATPNANTSARDKDVVVQDKDSSPFRAEHTPFGLPTAMLADANNNTNGNGNTYSDAPANPDAMAQYENHPHLPSSNAGLVMNETVGSSAPSVIVLEDSEEEESVEEKDESNVEKKQPIGPLPGAGTATHVDGPASLPTQPLEVRYEHSSTNTMGRNDADDVGDCPVEVPVSQPPLPLDPRDSRVAKDVGSDTSAISVPEVSRDTAEYVPVAPPGPRNANARATSSSTATPTRSVAKRRRIIKQCEKTPTKGGSSNSGGGVVETIELDPSDDVERMSDERNSANSPTSPARTAQVEVSELGQGQSILPPLIISINGEGNEQNETLPDEPMLDSNPPDEVLGDGAPVFETDGNVNNNIGNDLSDLEAFNEWGGTDNVSHEPAVSHSEQPQRASSEVLFRFPPVGRGRITVRYEDYDRLYKREYLNDSLIDFYIKFIEMEQANTSTPSDAQRPPGKPYFFSSFFYTKLRPNTAVPWSEIDYNGVKRWTASVDLFEKELIFMPICDSSHWSLIIIVNLNEMQACLDDDTRFDKLENNKQPRILYFDSLEPKRGPSFGKMVVHYLAAEYYERKVDQDEPDGAKRVYEVMNENINIDWPYVPRQINEVDCGLYLLHNISCFIDESTRLRKLCLRGPRKVGKVRRQVQIKHFYSHTEVHNLRQYILLLIMELEKGGATQEGRVPCTEVLAENHPAIFPPKELPPSVPAPTPSSSRLNGRVEPVFEDKERAGLEDSDTGAGGEQGQSLAALAAANLGMDMETDADVTTAEQLRGGVAAESQDVEDENMDAVDVVDMRGPKEVERIDDDDEDEVKFMGSRSTGAGRRSRSKSSSPPRQEIPPGSAYGKGHKSVPVPPRRARASEHGRNLRSRTGSQPRIHQMQPRRSTRSSSGNNPRYARGINITTPGRQRAAMPQSTHGHDGPDKMVIDTDNLPEAVPSGNDAIMTEPGNGSNNNHTAANEVIDLDN